VEQAHRNISVLSELGREMSASLDMETTMQTLYRHVNHLMNAQIFGIGFVREDEGVIDFPFAIEGACVPCLTSAGWISPTSWPCGA
jgi:hypothetical protein